jgi:hypothetical protein
VHSRKGINEVKAANDSWRPNRIAIAITHAELGRNGPALVEDACSIRVDRRQDCVSRGAVTRLAGWRIQNAEALRYFRSRIETRIAGLARGYRAAPHSSNLRDRSGNRAAPPASHGERNG